MSGTEIGMLEPDSFAKGHGLGNDYVIMEPETLSFPLSEKNVALICDRHLGIGSDGILTLGPSRQCDVSMGVLNPDGSIAEMCGNGMRIFARYLYEKGIVKKVRFRVETLAGVMEPEIILDDRDAVAGVTVDMGHAVFDPERIPVLGQTGEGAPLALTVDGVDHDATAVSMGNPHCVVFVGELDEEEVRRVGPVIERMNIFPNRTNVQFVLPLDAENVRAMIWERGAGYTLASGTSSCAVAAVCRKRGLVGPDVTVRMPGGELRLSVGDDYRMTMTGPAVIVCEGRIDAGFKELMTDA